MTRLALLALVVAALSAAGCGPQPGDEPFDAASSSPDVGQPLDAGAPADAAAEPLDAATPPDAASQPDAGAPEDASAQVDAEVVPDDAGPSPADAEVSADVGQTPAQVAAAAEQKAAATLDSIAGDPAQLAPFLVQVPKGGDLHMHLSGAIYAETYLEWARTEGMCINSSSLSVTSNCSASTVPVPATTDALYQQIVEAWSMENFQPGAETGHDHFFATFGKYGGISGSAHHGKMLADVMKRADGENESYLELMLISASAAGTLGENLWSTLHPSTQFTASDFDNFRQDLIYDSGWTAALQPVVADVTAAETEARQILGCGTAQPDSACRVATRYEVYVSRSGAATNVFAQLVAGYEAARKDARIVAVNLVGPEDNGTALSRYDLEMSMLGFLKDAYAGKSPARISLHAGELAASYMPGTWNIGTINHVRKAVEVAGAERIGHGIDILLETDPAGLMASMAASGIAVEICLSSNIQILEVSGSAHPLSSYLAAKVPVSLATDDQGVSRSSIAEEWTRAVTDQNLRYLTLKAMARNSLQYSFLPGARLFTTIDPLVANPACAPTDTNLLGDEVPTSGCAAFLAQSARAQAQWDLEKRFRAFEAAQ